MNGLTIEQSVRQAAHFLKQAQVPSPTPMLDGRMIVRFVTGFTDAELIANGHDLLRDDQARQLEDALDRRGEGEPVAYILGEKEFFGRNFTVSRNVLIPRPESELIIEAGLRALRDKRDPVDILDLGTGSGCLLATLLCECVGARGVGIDISLAALRVAESNLRALSVRDRAELVCGSWTDSLGAVFDLVVINAPYVPDTDRPTLSPSVLDFEPHSALFAGNDGLHAYRMLIPQLTRVLKEGGTCLFEIGGGQAPSMVSLIQQSFPGGKITSVNDLAGIPRTIVLTV
ncbi:MAG: peptide chain release factor N(5)-glutamine methyltransferase [Pseudomonadota bacterium]